VRPKEVIYWPNYVARRRRRRRRRSIRRGRRGRTLKGFLEGQNHESERDNLLS
jgi:hypothetical protein